MKLVGIRRKMSFGNDQTGSLWREFMPRRKEIKNTTTKDLYSLQQYGTGFRFDPQTELEKWALAAVSDFDDIPGGMEPYLLKGGKYAVFRYKGPGGDPGIFRYIFSDWLPRSGYILDSRPHFEVLGEGYKGNDPDSEEAIWIPITTKPT